MLLEELVEDSVDFDGAGFRLEDEGAHREDEVCFALGEGLFGRDGELDTGRRRGLRGQGGTEGVGREAGEGDFGTEEFG